MENQKRLEKISKEIRKDVLDMALEYNDGHIAPAYSCVEILVSLYESVMSDDDKFILGKGHGCLSLYAILRKKGFNPKISGHPDIEPEQGIVCSTGSLGHGIAIGVGIAFAKKIKKDDAHVFVLIGDGECQEGTIWESLNLARKLKIDNLTVIIDNNGLQALATIKEIMDEKNLVEKFQVFGCYTVEAKGHDFDELLSALDKENVKKGKMRAVFAKTVKGKGLSFMENKPVWHSKIPQEDLLKKAYKELE